jgi:glycerol kinase
MSILAIDQGTTSTRALLLTNSQDAHIVCAKPHQQFYPQQGWVEHDPMQLINNLRYCIEASSNVDAIAIANQGESCLAWHSDTKEPICQVLVWQDNRTFGQTEALKTTPAKAIIEQKTGLPLDSYFSASKLAWIIDNVPQATLLLAQGKLRLGTTDAFFLDTLCDRFVTDITTASRTSLMNLSTSQWDPQLCELFGVPIETLPKIVPSSGDFGVVHSKGRAIPVITSMVDQQASLYGHNCTEVGDAKVTFGTGAFAMCITGAEYYRAPEKGLLPTIAWQKNNELPVYALDGGVHCASSAINWAKQLGLFNKFEQINQFDKPAAITRNLVFVPALMGLACPHWDRSAAGLWIGLSLDTQPLDMVQAVIEGVAMRAVQVLQAMSDFTSLTKRISIDGGMSRNPYFCQFLADVLQCEVQVPVNEEVTALGLGLFARDCLLEVSKQTAQSVNNQSRNCKVYPPNKSASQCFSQYLEKFNEAVERSKNWSA